MFSSQSGISSTRRNPRNSTRISSNYWYTEDNFPYVNLFPSGSTINATDIDTNNNYLYVGGSFSRLYQNNANYHSIYDISSSTFKIKSKNYGTNGRIYAYAFDSVYNILYVGGDFTTVTDNNDITIDASYVAAWSISKQRWRPFGRNRQNGLNAVCNALAVDVNNQILYVGGNFTKMSDALNSDQSANYVAQWMISSQTWAKLGAGDVSYNNGLNSICRTLVYDASNTQLYVGGDFTKVRDGRGLDISANRVAIWKPSQSKWNGFGTFGQNGTNGQILAYVYDSCKNVMYAGGTFTRVFDSSNITGLSANRIAKWDIGTSSWSILGASSFNGLLAQCNALAMDTSNQILYAGGTFTSVYDAAGTLDNTQRVAAWNVATERWSRLGSTTATTNGLTSTSAYCSALTYDSSNSRLYVGGNFTTLGDASASGILANYVAYWNIATSRWVRFGTGTTSANQGVSGIVYSLELDTSNNHLYVGGGFNTVYHSTGTTYARAIVRWNVLTSTWTALGTAGTISTSTTNGTNGTVYSMKYDGSNNRLYVGGNLTTASSSTQSSISLRCIGYWDTSDNKWYPLGGSTSTTNGTNGEIYSFSLDTSNNRLYVGGNFITTNDASSASQSGNYVAYWNIATSRWIQMGGTTSTTNGTNNLVSAIALDQSKNVFLGGIFTKSSTTQGDTSANYGIIWAPSTSNWSNLGATYYRNGLTDGSCNAFALDSTNRRVYVGGSFTTVKDSSNVSLSANRIAYWDLNTSAWYGLGTTSSTGNGVDASVNALAFDTANNRLYVGGNFKKMSDSSKADQSANYVAFWDASNSLWGQLGGTDFSKNGVDASVNALAFDSTNNILYVGGNFLKVYDTSFTLASPLKSQYLATWNPITQRWTQIGYSSSSTASLYGLSNVCRALTYNSFNKFIYVGGDHTSVCDSSNISADASNIAYVDLTSGSIYPLGTSSYNGTNSIINNIKVDTTNNVVYVDGSFTTVYDSSNRDLSANYIAKYDVSTKTWSRLGSRTSNGLGGMGKAMFYDNTNNALYASGAFTAVRDSTTDTSKNFNYVAKWDVAKSAWSPLGSYGNGTNGTISVYAYDAANYRVFCGGSFTQVYDNSNTTLYARNVAVFDMITSTWSVLGASDVSYNNGLNLACRTLTYDTSNTQLYVGGDFTSVRDGRGVDISANKIAIWKPSTSRWSGMGTLGQNGTNGQILTYAYDSCKNVMYAGGTFTTVFDTSNIMLSANRIAKWDLATSTWTRLGTSSLNGVDGSCNAFAMDTSNQILYVGGNFTNVYDAAGTLSNTQEVAKWNILTERWSRLGESTATTNGLTSTSAYCNALLYDSSNSRLYVGGSFTKVGDAGEADQSANNVAYWSISTSRWAKLGTTDVSYNNGTNAYVNTLAYDGSYNRLYVGGNFTKARDVSSIDISMNYVGYWDISTSKWGQLGGTTSTTNGVNAQCRTLVYDNSNAELYVGGDFTTAYNSSGSTSTGYLTKWIVSSSSWYAMSGSSSRTYTLNGSSQGVNLDVFASAYYNSIIYLGGSFTTTYSTNGGTVAINYLAGYNTSSGTWSALGSGVNGDISIIYPDSTNNKIYIGGGFTTVNGTATSASKIAVYNISTSTWSALGSGLGANAIGLALDYTNNKLYVGGSFTTVNGTATSANRAAVWDISNSTWSALGTGLDAVVYAVALDSTNQKLYVGGAFTNAGGNSANRVAVWNISTSTWSALGSGVSAPVYSIQLDSTNQKLYVAGDLLTASGITANRIAVWNIANSTWAALGTGLGAVVSDIRLDSINQKLYVGGNFTTAGGTTANRLAVWDISTSTWSALGSGLDGIVYTVTLNSANSEIYVGGFFTTAGGTTASKCAIYSIANNSYYPIGNYTITGGTVNLLNGLCYSLSLDTSNNRLYAGGSFTTVSSSTQTNLSANYVAYWNIATSTWSQMGGTTSTTNGTNALVSAIALDQSKNAFIGGNFTKVSTTARDISANYGIIWTPSTSSWTNLGVELYRNGLTDGSCNALALDSSNQRLYVGGSFTTVKDSSNTSLSANRIAYWNLNTSAWSGLGTTDTSKNGLDGSCNALVLDSSYTRLYVGGNFKKVSDSAKIDQSANYVAFWDTTSSIWGKLGATDDSSNNGVKALVRTLAYDNANAQVYVGGDFIEGRDGRSCDISMNRVAIWKPSTKLWSGMGSVVSNGTNGFIYAQKFDSSNNVLYVGGTFTELYDTSNIRLTANYIAKWNIATKTWSRLGDSSMNGTNAYVNCIVLNSTKLYVGGGFGQVYDKSNNTLTNVMYMAQWDLTTNTWSRMGGGTTTTTNGLNVVPSSMVIDTSNQVLYVSWKTAGSAIALYDASNTGTAMTANAVAAFDLYSQRWSRLGSSTSNGIQNQSNCGVYLVFDNSNSNLYAVMSQNSSFYYVRDDRGIDLSINSIARWNVPSQKWFGLGGHSSNGTNGQINAYAYDNSRNRMYVGGGFTRVFDLSQIWLDVSNVAAWDVAGKYWVRLGSSGSRNGVDGSVNALAFDTSYSRLYVGGNFKKMSDASKADQSANYVTYWDVSNSLWGQLGGTTTATNGLNAQCNTLIYDGSNSQLYVGGEFTQTYDSRGTLYINRIAIWKPSTSQWTQIGNLGYNGTNGQILAYVYDSCKNVMYAGGTFTQVYDSSNIFGLSANRVAKWDIGTSIWTELGTSSSNGVDSSCNAFAMDTSNQILYVGGNFTNVYDSTGTLANTQKVAKWDVTGSTWSRLGNSTATTNGLTSTSSTTYCSALSYDSSNSRLYVGGSFTKVGDAGQADQSANNVVYWNIATSRWANLGASDVSYNNGVNRECRTLIYDASNTQLYVGGDFTTVRDSRSVDISANKIAIWKPSVSKWYGFGNLGNNGTNGQILTYAYDSCKNVMYAGGTFTQVYDSSNIFGLSANRIAKWDFGTSSWSRLGTSSLNGVDGSCNALAMDTSNQILYVGGNFTNVYDAAGTLANTQKVAKWDVTASTWSRLGSTTATTNGLTSTSSFTYCLALTYDSSNSRLYVGGEFTTVGDASASSITANKIVYWNIATSRWVRFGTGTTSGTQGVNNAIYGLELDTSNNHLYVGGGFSAVYHSTGTTYARHIVRWNVLTSTWTALGTAGTISTSTTNGTNGFIYSMKYDGSNNRLYVGGNFDTASSLTQSSISLKYIGYWSILDNKWYPLGTTASNGTNVFVYSLALDTSNNRLYAGGNFTTTSDANTSSQSGNYVAYWDVSNTKWIQMGGTTNGTNALVSAIALDQSKNVFLGGSFTKVSTTAKDTSANYVIIWTPSTSNWTNLGVEFRNGLTDGSCNALALDSSNQRLYVGGSFTTVKDSSNVSLSANRIAYWDLNTSAWSQLGTTASNGTGGQVYSLALDTSNNRLYAGGNFTTTSDATTASQSGNYVAYWDVSNTKWIQMGGSTSTTNGTNALVTALTLDQSKNAFIGGNFTNASATSGNTYANNGIIWTSSTSSWTAIGTAIQNGLDGSCNAFALDSSNSRLYVGGNFKTVSDASQANQSANYIAYLDISNSLWKQLGTTDVSRNGLNALCNALALDSFNSRLYVGGNFKKVSDESQIDQSANYIAYWDIPNSLWKQLGTTDPSKNGLDGSCNALIYDNSNNRLYVGGAFKKVSDSAQQDQSANYVAFWDVANSIWKQLGGTTSTRNGTSDVVNALAVDASKNVFVGGKFVSVNDSAYSVYLANYNAFWSPSTSRWSRLGSIVSNGLSSISAGNQAIWNIDIDTSNSILYGAWSSSSSAGYGYYDASNTSGLVGKSLCGWDIKNECWFYITGSSSAVTASYANGVKVDPIKKRVYYLFTGSNRTIISDSSNGSLNINALAYYDMITKRVYPLGGAQNSNSTLTNGLLYYNGSTFTDLSYFNDPGYGISYLETDNSANLYATHGNVGYTQTTYNVACDNNQIQLFRSIVMWDASNSQWSVLGSNIRNGLDASCISMVYDNSNQELYVGGNFANTTDSQNDYLPRNIKTPISKVAKWSIGKSRWSSLAGQRFDASNGTNGAIYASVYDSCKNIIYMGGNFTLVSDTSNGDLSANYIAAWDVSNQYWSRIGTAGNNGLSSTCYALAIDSSNQKLYVGGQFQTVFDGTYLDQSVNYVAAWNITSQKWSILGGSEAVNGLDGSCNAMAFDSLNNLLYVGGFFRNMRDATQDQSANYVAYWNVSSQRWSRLGASDLSYNNGLNAACRTLTYDTSNTQLYVGGDFTTVRDGRGVDISANRIAIWKPSQSKWYGFGPIGQNGTNGQILVYAYDSCKNVMYAGGTFTQVFDTSNIMLSANRVAKWNIATSCWSRLSDSSWNGVDGSCNAFAMDTSNQVLYVGGNFTTVYDSSNTNTLTNTQKVAKWSILTERWSRLGESTATTNGLTSTTTSTYCSALAYDSANSRLYVGGSFTKVGDASYADFSANNVAYWNISNSRWSKLGASDVSYNNGLNLECRTLIYDASNTQLYVGGDFTTVRDGRGVDISTNKIAIWKPSLSKWYGFGNLGNNGTNGQILAYVYDSCKNVMYAGGTFTQVYDSSNIMLSANRVAKWNIATSCWSRLSDSSSNGVDGSCNAFAMDTSNQVLYLGGNFTNVYDASGTLATTQKVAKWSILTERWSRLGESTATTNGLTSTSAYCSALAYDSANSILYVGGNFTKVGDASYADFSANNVAYWNISNSRWSKLGASDVSYNNGLNLECRTLIYDASNTQLYVGGDFTVVRDSRAIDISANRVAIWKPSQSKWYGFGTLGQNGTNGQILAYVYDSCKNVMYAGGTFTRVFDTSNITGLSANRVAKWDFGTSGWSRLTDSSWNGVDGSCNAFAMDTSNQVLYVGGNFTTVYDSSNTNTLTNTQKVAKWTVATERWSRLGESTATTNGLTSTSAYCSALVYDSSNSRLYVGGNFTKVGDASYADFSANNVAYWNISNSRWSKLGASDVSYNNGLNLECRTLIYDASNTQLYVGGDFTTVRDGRGVDISTNKIAIWKPSLSKWYGFGTLGQNGTNGQILTYVYDSCKNVMYAGGTFTRVFDTSNITGLSANRVAKWDIGTSSWTTLGTSSLNGVDGSCNALAMDTSNQILYVGGNFTNAYDSTGTLVTTQKVAKWDINASTWSRLGSTTSTTNGLTSTSAYCSALVYDSSNSRLYVGGSFTKVGDAGQADQSANNVAYWNISTSRWAKLGTTDVSYNNGTNAYVNTLAYDGSYNRLYVGGNFTKARDVSSIDISMNYVGYWDISTSKWGQLGGTTSATNGLNLECRTLIYDTSNTQLYVGGDFTSVRDGRGVDISANKIAIWKPSTSRWSGMGTFGQNGTNGQILTYAYDSCKNVMYAGGTFTTVFDTSNIGGLSANRIAKWDLATSCWSRLGTSSSNGLDGSCNALAMDTSNQILYVGGNFTNVYDASGTLANTQEVAKWTVDTERWSRLGESTATTNGLTSSSAYCNALLYDSANRRLYVGGSFTKVGDAGEADQSANNVAYWNISTSRWGKLGTTDVSYNNGTNAYVNALAYDGSYNRLYVGGNFTKARDVSSIDISMNYVGYWDISTSKWGQFGGTTSTTNGLNAQCRTLVYDSSNAELYVGGDFTTAYNSSGSSSVRYSVKWGVSSSSWYAMGGSSSRTYTLNGSSQGTGASINTVVYYNSTIYVGGGFTTVSSTNSGSVSANYVAAYNISNGTWSALGSGLNGSAISFALDNSNNKLYVGGNFTSAGGVASRNYVAVWNISNSTWSALGDGVGSTVYSVALDNSNNKLYVGGSFTSAGGVASRNYVAVWDISNSTWSALGSGVGSSLQVVAVDSSNSKLYVGGNFTGAGGNSLIKYIAVWDILNSTWSALGSSSVGNYVYAMLLDSSNSKLYVGGGFTSAGGNTASRVAVWDIKNSIWSALGNGIGNSTPYAFALDNSNNKLYVGGGFTSAGGVASRNYVAVWDFSNSTWSALGTGLGSQVNTLALDMSNNELYIGGNFTTAGGTTSSYATIYSTTNSSYYPVGNYIIGANNGTNGEIYSFSLDTSNNRLYVGGNFTTTSDTTSSQMTNYVAYWDVSNTKWTQMGGTTNGTNALVSAIALDQSKNAFLGGNFTKVSTTSGDTSANYGIIWTPSTSNWSNLGAGLYRNGLTDGSCNAFALDSSNQRVYVGGSFTTVKDSSNTSLSANRIAYWDLNTSTWSQMGGTTSTTNGTNALVTALALDQSKNVFVGGNFTKVSKTAGDISANYGIIWTPSTSSWSNLGAELYKNGLTDGSCIAMTLDSSNQRIYVGGSFTTVKDSSNVSLSANRIAYWDLNTSAWSRLGTSASNGTGGQIYSLALDTSNNRLYAGGNFTITNDATTASQSGNYVAYWDVSNTKWTQMGGSTNGTNALVTALALDQSKNVFIGGNFTKVSKTAGDISANYGIIWTPSTSSWSNLGAELYKNGLTDGSCIAMTLDSSNQRLYVGGSFTTVKDSSNVSLSANRIAYWDLNTSAWSRLGTSASNGTGGQIYSLALDTSNNRLYVGGNFTITNDATTASQSGNYVAYWDVSNTKWIQMGGSTNGTNALVTALALDQSKNVFIGGNFTRASNTSTDISANYGIIWTPSTTNWTNLGDKYNSNGLTDGSCIAMTLDSSNQRIYVGGSFTTVNDSSNRAFSTNRIAYWDLNTSAWSRLGTSASNGTNAYVDTLELDTSNNRLYAGGNFTTTSDATTSNLLANYVAYWDVSNTKWIQMGGSTNGTNALVTALALDQSKNVFIGGNFTKVSTTAKDTSANYGIIWTPSTTNWTNLGDKYNSNGLTDGSCNALALDSTNQRLYVGGSFTTVKDVSNISLSANRIAYWDLNTSRWLGLGTTDPSKNGVSAICRTLNYNANNTTLYAGGDFTRASDSTGYDLSANYIVAWNPTTQVWQPLGSAYRNANNGLNNSAYTISTAPNNQVFVGGTFTGGYDISGSITSNYGLIWNPSIYEWSKFGGYSSIFIDGSINALAIDSSSTKLFIGGTFSRMSDHSGNGYNINDGAIWNIDSKSLSAMGSFNLNGLNFYPNIFAMDPNNNVLYMGGNFTAAYNQSNSSSSIFAMYVIGYDITNNKWIQLGNEVWNGVNGEVTGLTIDTTNSILYVSGNYTKIYDSSNGYQAANYIAAYNISTKTWGRLGSSTYNGTNSATNSIAFNSSNQRLYVGGNFTSVYDSSNTTLNVKYMAQWNTTTSRWSRIGANTTYNGVDASVNILQYNSSKNYLLTVGKFSNVNDSVNTKIRGIANYATFKF